MHALSDEQQLEQLGKKVDDGFSEMRADLREVRGEVGALHRTVIQVSFGLWLTLILGFAGILLQHI
jgi:hypothetical protein